MTDHRCCKVSKIAHFTLWSHSDASTLSDDLCSPTLKADCFFHFQFTQTERQSESQWACEKHIHQRGFRLLDSLWFTPTQRLRNDHQRVNAVDVQVSRMAVYTIFITIRCYTDSLKQGYKLAVNTKCCFGLIRKRKQDTNNCNGLSVV